MPRVAWVPVLTLAAVALGIAWPRSVSGKTSAPLGLQIEERLVQRLEFTRRGPGRGVARVETRRLAARARILLESGTAAALGANSRIGTRIGGWTFERRLGDDRRWRPSRERFRVRARAHGAAGREVVVLDARWRRGVLDLRVNARGVAPVAAAHREDGPGPLTPAVDAAVRLGPEGWRLGGTAEGTLARDEATVIGDAVGLARISVRGQFPILGETQDADLPAVEITSPRDDALLTAGTVAVTGALRDHRTIVEVLVSVNGGPPEPVAFTPDPESGFLTDLTAAFSVDVEPRPGRNSLVVLARDAAGNESVSSVEFAVVVPRAVPLAGGSNSALATDASGGVRLWGGPETLYAAPGATSSSPLPRAGLDGAVAMAAGTSHAVALFADGTVRTWGAGALGQLGLDPIPSAALRDPVEIPGLAGIVAVAATRDNTVALRADGTVFVWGANETGQIGNGTTGGIQAVPLAVPGLPPIRAIALGPTNRGSTVHALDEDGALWGWGAGDFGQLAPESFSDDDSPVPVRAHGLPPATSVAAGYGFAVAVVEDGRAFGWGRNNDGQTAAPGFSSAYTMPHAIEGAEGIVAAACGAEFTLLLRDDGAVLACGNNDSGQLGNGTTLTADPRTPASYPAPVPGLARVARIAAGSFTAHAVREDGSLWGWCWNAQGQVGDGSTEDRTAPVLVLLD